MLITVAEALKKGYFKEAKVVTGHKNLNNVITTAEVMETPQIVSRMQGGEFILSSGYSFYDKPELQIQLIKEFAEKKISVFGIQLGRYMTSIPEKMRQCADEYGLPLLELPANYSYMDFAMPFYEMVINRRVDLLRYSDQVHFELIEAVLDGQSVEGILSICLKKLNKPLLLLDKYGIMLNFRAMSYTPAKLQGWAKDIYQQINRKPLPDIAILQIGNSQMSAAIVSLQSEGNPVGFLVMLEVENTLDDMQQIILKEAKLLFTLELQKEKAVLSANRSAKSDLLEDLIYQSYRNTRVILRRGIFLSVNLSAQLQIFYFALRNPPHITTEEFQKENSDEIATLADIIYSDFAFTPYDTIVMPYGYGVICLLAFEQDNKQLDEKLQNLLYRASRHKLINKHKYIICKGQIVQGIDAVAASYQNAVDCYNIAVYFDDWGDIIDYHAVSAFSLISDLSKLPQARVYYEHYITKLVAYDQEHHGGLLETLQQYYVNHRNIKKTADKMFLHKNTVTYRLKKIEELVHVNLNQYSESLILEICVLLHRIGVQNTP